MATISEHLSERKIDAISAGQRNLQHVVTETVVEFDRFLAARR
jgi:hypothetical protein